MADLIDRDALIAELEDWLDEDGCFENKEYDRGIRRAIRCAKKAPAVDAVPVVRCKDCKFYHEDDYNDNGFPICNVSGMDRTEYDFCSYGERKDGAE